MLERLESWNVRKAEGMIGTTGMTGMFAAPTGEECEYLAPTIRFRRFFTLFAATNTCCKLVTRTNV